MNKPLPLAHMKKSCFRNQFLKTRFEVSRINFYKQHNYSISLLRKIKKQYRQNLN